MIVLGVDSAMATAGYAVIERLRGLRPRLVTFGVITTERNAEIGATTDRARRIAEVANQLRVLRNVHAVDVIAGEQPLGFGTVHAVLPQAMCFAAMIALAVETDIDCAEIPAKEWQHAVQSGLAKKIDYARLKADLAEYTGPRIESIAADLQTHALDAIGIALFAALRPVTLVWRGRARRERNVSRGTEGATA
jgi:Holliday junction resolvasome RuvABC endonuclease subunit